MSVEEYSLKFILLSKYSLLVVSIPRDEMSRFSDMMKEECHTTMLYGYMTLSRIMVYSQSIEESKLGGEVEMQTGEEPMSKLYLILRRGLQIKMVLVFLRLTMIEVVVSKWLSQLVLLVGRSTLGNA